MDNAFKVTLEDGEGEDIQRTQKDQKWERVLAMKKVVGLVSYETLR